MRKKIVAGNWKMNKNLQDGIALAKELNDSLAADKPNCGVVICTPFIHLAKVADVVAGTVIGLGAENCADKEKGAFTGEVSAAQVKSTGAQYVILGHSERRAYYGETAEILKEKVNLALANGLKVIFCIGEVLEEREATSPCGPSAPARPLPLSRLRTCTPSSVASSQAASAKLLQRTSASSTVAAASPATPRRSSPSPTWMAASSAALPSSAPISRASSMLGSNKKPMKW